MAVLRAQIALIPNSSGSYTFRKYGACGSDLAQLRWTVFMRTFIPWQLVRFVWINFKMIDMIRVSHGGRR